MELEKRFGSRWQAIAELAHVSEGGHDYIDEAELGLKYALHWDMQKQYIASTGLVAAFPIKDDAASNVIIPMLLGAKGLSDEFVAQGSFRAKLPVDRAADGEAEFATAIHWLPSVWPRSVFPGLELVATVPFEDNGGDSVQWSVLPQARIGLTRGGHVALNVGAELPLSDQSWDWRGYLYLLWDFADGSFFKGW